MTESEPNEDLKEFMREGRKIQGIKYLRETTGLGLKDAKEEYERMERMLVARGELEEQRGKGCGVLPVLLLAATAGLLLRFVF